MRLLSEIPENDPPAHDSTSSTTAQVALELMASIAHAARSKSGMVPFAQRNKQYWRTLFQYCLMTVSDPGLYKLHLQKQRQRDQKRLDHIQKKIRTKQPNFEQKTQPESESLQVSTVLFIHPPRQIAC